MRQDLNADSAEQFLGNCTRCNACRCFARAGTFEHIARIGEAIFLHASEVGVTGARLGQWVLGDTRGRRHLFVPLVAAEPLAVFDLNSNGRAERATMPYAADKSDFISFETLPRTTAVAETAPTHFFLDLFDSDG